MAEIVNLRLARKARGRAAAKVQAQSNRALHGRTRAEREQIRSETARIGAIVDGARIEREED